MCSNFPLDMQTLYFHFPGQRSCLSGLPFAVSRGASISWDDRSYFKEVVFLRRSFWYPVTPSYWPHTSSLCPRRAVSGVEPTSFVSDLSSGEWTPLPNLLSMLFPSVSLYDPDFLLILLLIHAPGEGKPDFRSMQVSQGFCLFYIYKTSLSRQLILQKSSVDGSVALWSVLGLGCFFCFCFCKI